MSDSEASDPDDMLGMLNRLVRAGSIESFEWTEGLVMLSLNADQWARLRQSDGDGEAASDAAA